MSMLEQAAGLFATELARAGAAVSVLNLPGFRQVPIPTRAFLALVLAIVCFTAKWAQPGSGLVIPAEFLECCVKNIVSGLFVAIAWNTVLDACALAIQVASVQSGLSYASIIDPTNDTESGSLLAVTQFCVLLSFLAAGVHLEFLGLLLGTDSLWPTVLNATSLPVLLKTLLTESFRIGIRLGAPFIAIMLLLDIASAIGGRFADRFQLATLVFPVKWAVTLLLLLASTVTIHRLEAILATRALTLAGAR